MEFSEIQSPIDGFDFDLLDDPNFKEDSVREELIVPILKALNYSASGSNKIIRSKSLKHPFVSIGSLRKNITVVPDYLLEVNGGYAWVLEAKGPNEKIINSKHVEQAYSYAIHNEVRVPLFALCNGREFVLYGISKVEPLVHFQIQELVHAWPALKKYLSPENVHNQEFKLAKDFGLHIKRIGFENFDSHIFPSVPVPFIGKIEPDKYRISAGFEFDEYNSYLATFDFNTETLNKAGGKLPKEAIDILNEPIEENEIKKVVFGDGTFHLTMKCKLGEELDENDDEIFLPLTVLEFL